MHSLCAGVSSPDDSTPGTFGFPEGFLPDLGLRTDRAVNPPLRSEVSALIDAARGENCPGCLAQGARSGSRRSCPTLFDAGHPAMVSKFAHYLRRSFRGEENRLPTIVSQPSASAKHRLATRGLSPGTTLVERCTFCRRRRDRFRAATEFCAAESWQLLAQERAAAQPFDEATCKDRGGVRG